MRPLAVVAAVLQREGRVLVCRRRADAKNPLKWEFPGGKIENGETPEEALSRELFEELGIRTRTGAICHAQLCRYPETDVLVLFYASRLLSGEPAPLEGQTCAWARPDELPALDFALADAPMARILAAEAGAKSDISTRGARI